MKQWLTLRSGEMMGSMFDRGRHQETESEWPQQGKTRLRIKRVGRNEKCPCGSGKKYKKCCSLRDDVQGALYKEIRITRGAQLEKSNYLDGYANL